VTTVPVPPSLALPMCKPTRLWVETKFSALPPVGVMVSVLPLTAAVTEDAAARSMRLPAPSLKIGLATVELVSIFSVAPRPRTTRVSPFMSMVLLPATAPLVSSSVLAASIRSVPVPLTSPLSFSAPMPAVTTAVAALVKGTPITLVPVPPVLEADP
jgi:hypothetical protein